MDFVKYPKYLYELCRNLSQSDDFSEEEVTQALEGVLENQGFRVVRRSRDDEPETRGGPDVVAYKDDGTLLIIEVKGVPSKVRVRGSRKGTLKRGSVRRSQFRKWLCELFMQLVRREFEWVSGVYVEITKPPWVEQVLRRLAMGQEVGQPLGEALRKVRHIRFVGVLGYHEGYNRVLARIPVTYVMKKLGYELWFMDRDGKLCTATPPSDITAF